MEGRPGPEFDLLMFIIRASRSARLLEPFRESTTRTEATADMGELYY
jgi:hypothetical protein